MRETRKDYLDEINQRIRDLKEVKSQIKESIKDVKVAVDYDSNPQIARAIKEVFGDIPEGHPDHNFITQEMYQHCINIMRQAGRAKGEIMINKGI